MSDHAPPPVITTPPSDTQRRLALTYAAFHETHAPRWRLYAQLHTGEREAAGAVARDTFAQLRRQWPHALRRRSAACYAWSLLKEHLHRWLTDRERPSALELTAFQRAAHALPREFPRQCALVESRIGLYAALARLPERQCDSLVLHTMIGYSTAQIAELLGIEESAVRCQIRHARRKLAPFAPPAPTAGVPHSVRGT
ncbi:RNA polymerase sigma factor [Streptomyces gamaensis]|uniref:RNA polymerase sigma factor n=1 Tax=Streptomyces gamaensis TaxID=1763542 RepID=A0ABW0Z1R4_9ACTN